MIPRRASSAIASAALIVVACGAPGPTASPSPAMPSATAAPTPPPSLTVAPSASPSGSTAPAALQWVADGLAESARIDVPLDYADPAAGTITLAVARRPAGDPAHRIGTLFINPGGPGAPAVGFVASPGLDVIIPPAVLDRFDVVTWDPRGVGLSGGIGCPDAATIADVESLDPNPSTSAELGAYRSAYDSLASQCQAAAGPLLRFMSEADTARDMDAIRAALGETTVSYLGWSYGTYLGYLYATMFPSHLRAAVLDGPVDPTRDLLRQNLSQSRGFEAALGHFFTLCAESASCAFHGGGSPATAYDALMLRLHRAPEGATLDEGQAVLGVLNWLYGTDLAGLANALASAERGDGSALRRSAASMLQGVSAGAYEATTCLDDRHPTTAADVEAALAPARRASPHFGALVTMADLYGCLDWPVPAEPVAVTAPPPGLPPVLVIAGTWDPATPPWGAAPLAQALGTGVVLTRDGVGHTSGASATLDPCLEGALTAYLNQLTAPVPGTVCTDAPVTFQP